MRLGWPDMISYGSTNIDDYRTAGAYVGRILKGDARDAKCRCVSSRAFLIAFDEMAGRAPTFDESFALIRLSREG
jgi:hypothetical protein